MGQQVVVDYRPGASGNIGMELASRATPDGYSVVINSLPIAVNQSLFSKLAFDVTRDLAPVCLLADSPFVLAVHPSVPATSVKELIALAKASPGRLNYSSAGSGTNLHIAAELFKNLAGVSLTHIPYKGGGPALAALLGNEAQLSFLGIMVVQAHQDAGRLRAIAVTSPKRSAVMPDVPTIVEAGVPGYAFSAWYGVLIPAAAPKAIVATWNTAIVKALRSPDMADRIAREGADVIASSPTEFGAYLKTELAKWAKVVKDNGLKVE
jgi:tripartite-type tricarboxylate transporter receptor subunit TctC